MVEAKLSSVFVLCVDVFCVCMSVTVHVNSEGRSQFKCQHTNPPQFCVKYSLFSSCLTKE